MVPSALGTEFGPLSCISCEVLHRALAFKMSYGSGIAACTQLWKLCGAWITETTSSFWRLLRTWSGMLVLIMYS
jgi:hypothetical protein